MNIQSLSIVVPTKNTCVNNCKFCVSRTHTNPYSDNVSKCLKLKETETYKMEYKDYYNRLEFARDNGCNVVILTGTGEPTQNFKFLEFFHETNLKLPSPFKNIEIQSTGVLLDEAKIKRLREIGITTMALSISNIFDNERNLELIECKKHLRFDLNYIIDLSKKYDFNLRFSLNLVDDYDSYSVKEVMDRCKLGGANQVTFRKLYKSGNNGKIDKWIDKNASTNFYDNVVKYVKEFGTYLGRLPFGAYIYDVDEMSVVVDDDCMNEEIKDTYKYLILRENCKLYSKWETKASLIF